MGIHILITLHPLAVCPLHLPLQPGWFSSSHSTILLLLVYLLPSCAVRPSSLVALSPFLCRFARSFLPIVLSFRVFLSPVALAVLHRLLLGKNLFLSSPLVLLASEAMHLRRTLTSPPWLHGSAGSVCVPRRE